MPANPHLKCDKEKQSLSEWVGEMSTESHMWWETESGEREIEKESKPERERDGEIEETVPSLQDSVPETRIMLLPPQWVTLTGYCLCSILPLCDWWASFCQLMENPLLTTIRLPFVTVSVSDCHRFILIRDLFLLRLFYCASNLQNWVHSDTPGKRRTVLFAIINLSTKCTA